MRGESVDRTELFVRHEAAPEGVCLSMSARPLRDERGTVCGGVAVFRDVSDGKATQAQVMVADRMASRGTLAAGGAPEINNPRGSVGATCRLAIRPAGRDGRTAHRP